MSKFHSLHLLRSSEVNFTINHILCFAHFPCDIEQSWIQLLCIQFHTFKLLVVDDLEPMTSGDQLPASYICKCYVITNRQVVVVEVLFALD